MLGRSRREDPELDEPRRDTELTLGPAMLIGIGCGLLLLCALCFGVGYSAGRRSGERNVPTVTQTATGQTETAPPGGSLTKPTAKSTMPAVTAPQTAADTPTASTDGTASSNPLTSYGSAPAAAPNGGSGSQALVKPALTQNAIPAGNGATGGGVQQAGGQAGGVMVQIAAVSHAEDATVLVGALRKRGYAATARRQLGDELIHVQIGPFANRNDANAMMQKLLGDGYNAEVVP